MKDIQSIYNTDYIYTYSVLNNIKTRDELK